MRVRCDSSVSIDAVPFSLTLGLAHDHLRERSLDLRDATREK